MPTPLDREQINRHLENLDLRALFIEELGWDRGGPDLEVPIAGRTYVLEAVAHKRGLVAYQCMADSDAAFPDHPTRGKIEKAVAKTVREHLIVYVSPDRHTQCWQWVKREPGRPDRTRTHIYRRGQSGESLSQKLYRLAFALDEEESVTLVDVTRRVRAAFDVEKVTKRFYDRFKKEHAAFLDFIEGIAAGVANVAQRRGWNHPAPPVYGLPTETWREHVARRRRYEEVRATLAAGKVASINDLITYNLDIETFAQDVIAGSEGPELVRAFWKALRNVSVLDPTCGSGAFLFAALNVLEPLYTACLDAMRGFLDDLDRSQRRHRPEKLGDFRKVLRQVEAHASERYFILKSIIIDNLYGVDVMEEAVEICKLRLFLKLVAQLDRYEQIEPLPDVDFNVRAGNTLVGFTSLEEVKRTLSADLLKQLSLPQIEERAEIADRAFRKFREMQTEHGMDAGKFASAKVDLRKRLDDLRNELDEYLAGDYGVKVKNRKAYRQWRDSHQPFHWFVEFYGIMHRGGFDVIIGNPPYVETPKISSQYSLQKNALVETGNLYAICLGRFVELLGSRQRYGVIVPISSVSTPRMVPLMRLLASNSSIHISNFAVRPAKLFVGVDMNLSIWIGTPLAKKNPTRIFTTSYNRWNQAAREYLFSTISYVESAFHEPFSAIFKIDSEAGRSILNRVTQHRSLVRFRAKKGHNSIFYHSGGRYFRKCIRKKLSNEYKELPLQEQASSPILCLLSSSLYYWLWLAFSDCYHVTRPDVEKIPIPDSVVSDKKLHNLSDALIDDLEKNAQVRNRQRADGSEQQEVNYSVGKSKYIIDQIDRVLAKHYDFTDEELDFIINYDIKYRMGLSNLRGDED